MSLDLFKERLGNARREAGMTQAEPARRLGVTAQAVSKWERGNTYPDIELLDGIFKVLDCSPDYLFQYEKGAKSFAGQDSLERRAELERLMLKDSVALWFGYGLVEMFLEEQKNKFVSVHKMRREMAEKYGFCVPVIRFGDSLSCAPQEYKIFIYGREAAFGTVYPSKRFAVNKKAEKEGDIEVIEPAWNLPGIWTDAVESENACDAMQFIMIRIIEVLDEMADERPTVKKAAECVAAALGEAYSFSL